MANSILHADLPYPVKGARYTVAIPYLDADGDPTDPTTPDTEVSVDGAAFGDTVEEVTVISGGNGLAFLTLTGAETNGSLVAVAAKAASGPKTTLLMLNPRTLPVYLSGTAGAGAANSLTLPNVAGTFRDLRGAILRTTGGTGGGGTGGANNQARVITVYDPLTRVATVSPNWEVAPDNTTTFEVLVTAECQQALLLPPGVIAEGVAQASAAGTLVLAAATDFGADGLPVGAIAQIVAGTGRGQSRVITGYTNATDTATIDPNWTTTPNTTSHYWIWASPPAPTVSLPAVNVAQVNSLATPATNLATAFDTTLAEVGAVPAANASLWAKINFIFAMLRNKMTATASTLTLRNDADTASIGSASQTDDGTTYTRNEWI